MKIIIYVLISIITPVFLYYMYLLCNLSVEHLDKPYKWLFFNYFYENITTIIIGGVLFSLLKALNYFDDRSK